jgi:hypothetical protein
LEFKKWDFDKDRNILNKSSGSLALKIKLDKAFSSIPPIQKGGLLRPKEFMALLTTQSQAISVLAKYIPEALVNLPFPGDHNSNLKFELMNGWRLKEYFRTFREAYKRARWYLQRKKDQTLLSFSLFVKPNGTDKDAQFDFLLNGDLAKTVNILRGKWTKQFLELDSIPLNGTFVFEMLFKSNDSIFDHLLFRIKNRKIVSKNFNLRKIFFSC